jgi:hypothetical protein
MTEPTRTFRWQGRNLQGKPVSGEAMAVDKVALQITLAQSQIRLLHCHAMQVPLPRIGARLTKGGSVYSIVDETTGIEKVTQHKNEDPALVEQVTVLGTASDKCVGCRAGMSATRAARVVDAPALLAGPSRRST